MEIIKKRIEWQGQFTCSHCGATLLIKEEDVEYRVIMESDSFTRGNFYFNCPECQQHCSLGEFGPDGLIYPIKQKAVERYEKKEEWFGMTEKEKTLELVIKHFIATAKERAKSKNERVMVNANQGHWTAIEVAGLGAHVSTIDWAVREYLKESKKWFFGHDNFSLAFAMTLTGASKEVAEEVLVVAVKHYSWIWPVEKLTAYLGRDPKEEEIFEIVRNEVAHTAVLSKDYHTDLVKFAEKYLSPQKVREIRYMLEGKIEEFHTHSD